MSGPGQKAAMRRSACGRDEGDVVEHGAVADVDDERVPGRAFFGSEDAGDGVGVEGVGSEAVDGLGGEGDGAAAAEDCGGASDVAGSVAQALGAEFFGCAPIIWS